MTAQLRGLIAASALAWSAAGADSPDRAVDEPASLPEAELREITLSLLQLYPELAASPGVKASALYTGGPGPLDGASVIFYPHADSHGIKEAFQVYCQRAHASQTWMCDEVTIRRYLRLDSQDFEVRLTGPISAEAALALIDASRRDLQASMTDATDLPSTTISIMPQCCGRWDGSYLVTWGTPEGYGKLDMLARLAEGGDPVKPDAWHATIVVYDKRE